MRYCIFILIILISFAVAPAVFAQVVINEIMYDLEGSDTDREWIEVQNSSSADIDLSAYKFFENNTNHSLVPFQGGSTLGAGAYAVIADKAEAFLTDWPNFAGILFDSSFSLSNTGETLSIKDSAGIVLDQVTYDAASGGQGDGKSLAKVAGSFVAGTPSPGVANSSEGSSESSQSGSSSSTSTSSTMTTEETQTEPEPGKISAEIIVKNTGFAKVPVVFQTKALDENRSPLTTGRFFWNFGDLITQEDKESKRFEHTFDYPGDYVVILDYYRSFYSYTPDATDRAIVKILQAQLEISNVGTAPDIFVEITNKGSTEIDLSKWILSQGINNFFIPQNTIILSGKKIIFASKITGFTEPAGIKLSYPSGEVATFWQTTLPPLPVVSVEIKTPKKEKPKKETQGEEPKEEIPVIEAIQTAEPAEPVLSPEPIKESLGASAAKAIDDQSVGFWLLALAGIIVLALAIIFYLRSDEEEEFRILE